MRYWICKIFSTNRPNTQHRQLEGKARNCTFRVNFLGMDFDDGSAGIAGFVLSTVLWGFYCFLKHKHSYADAVSLTIAGGGDTDSTAAVVGCLSGAYLGIDYILKHHPNLVRHI